MPSRESQTSAVEFLVYTRAASFDYTWIYGLEDKVLETQLQQHILKWLNTTLLTKLRPVTTFFEFKNHLALMIAEESDTRTDSQSRPIFQRAIFLWSPTNEMYYGHLGVLAELLAEVAQEVYSELPNDVYRVATSTRRLPLDVKTLDKLSRKSKRGSSWELPGGLNWSYVLQNKLTIEVPESWSFDRMIEGLSDVPLVQGDVIHIGNSLHFENRFPAERSWIISGKPFNGHSEEIRVLDAHGQAVQIQKKNQETQRLGYPRVGSYSVSPPRMRIPGSDEDPQSQEKNENAAKPHPGTVALPKDEGAQDLETLFFEFSNFDKFHTEAEKLSMLRKFFDRDHLAIKSAESRLLFLLIPARHRIPIEIFTAWHYLISEILISYHDPASELLDEWIRRMCRLEDITTEHLPKIPAKWRADFKTACESLRTILKHDH